MFSDLACFRGLTSVLQTSLCSTYSSFYTLTESWKILPESLPNIILFPRTYRMFLTHFTYITALAYFSEGHVPDSLQPCYLCTQWLELWEASHLPNSQVRRTHVESHSAFTLEQYILLTLQYLKNVLRLHIFGPVSISSYVQETAFATWLNQCISNFKNPFWKMIPSDFHHLKYYLRICLFTLWFL